MNTIKTLDARYFFAGKSNSGENVLKLHMNENQVSIILFYSRECPYCGEFIKLFKELPNIIGNCSFYLVNIDNDRKIVQEASKTATPIEYVPMVVLYVGSNPYYFYNGEATIDEFLKFITEVTKNLSTTMNSVQTYGGDTNSQVVCDPTTNTCTVISKGKGLKKKCYVKSQLK